jgi:hypothetical protein
MSLTLSTLQALMSWSKAEAEWNIMPISLTLATLQPPIF